MSVAEQALSLYAAETGALDDVEVKKIVDFEASLQAYARAEHADLLASINDSGAYDKDIQAKLSSLLESFKSTQTW